MIVVGSLIDLGAEQSTPFGGIGTVQTMEISRWKPLTQDDVGTQSAVNLGKRVAEVIKIINKQEKIPHCRRASDVENRWSHVP